MKPTTVSLFEQEMRDQVAAARDAVAEAERRGDPLLVQAATSHLESLLDLARRNGVLLEGSDAAIVVPEPADPVASDVLQTPDLTTPAV
jgi:hypothetical protein